MDAKGRIKYWKEVLSKTDRLAETLDKFLQKQDLSIIKPFQI